MPLCRTCLSENDLQPIFTDTNTVKTRSEQLYSVTGVKIEPDDGFPQVICTLCTSLVRYALKLREQSSKSHELLNKTFTLMTKINSNGDCYVKVEQDNDFYDENDESQLTNESNSNPTLVQIQNDQKSSCSNLEQEKKKKKKCNSNSEYKSKDNKNKSNLNLEQVKKKTNNFNSNSEYKTGDNKNNTNLNLENRRVDLTLTHGRTARHETDNKGRKRGNYQSKEFNGTSSDFKYSVLIEDYESSNDDLTEDICIEDLESPGDEEPIKKVSIEDFESSDDIDLDELKCDTTDLVEVYDVINPQKRAEKILKKEMKRLSAEAEDRRLMSLAVKPFNAYGLVKCQLCNATLGSVRTFKCHAKTHFELENACEECGKKFANRNHMLYHQQRLHGRTKRLACTQCSFRAVDLQTLRNHVRAQHTGERPYVCNECGRSFRMRANIVQHMRKHFGVRKWQCDRCPSMFRSRSELWGHQNKVHFMIYTYLCYLCPETYKRPLPVRRHLLNVHGVALDQQMPIKCVKTRRRSSNAMRAGSTFVSIPEKNYTRAV